MTITTLPAETLSDSDLAQQMVEWSKKLGGTRNVYGYAKKFRISYTEAKRVLDLLTAQGLLKTIAHGRDRHYGVFELPKTVREEIYQFRPLKPVDQVTKERLQEIAEQRRLYPSRHL